MQHFNFFVNLLHGQKPQSTKWRHIPPSWIINTQPLCLRNSPDQREMDFSRVQWKRLLYCFFLLLVVEIKGENEEKKQIYVVYMGSASPDSSKNFLRERHLQLLSSVLKRLLITYVYLYYLFIFIFQTSSQRFGLLNTVHRNPTRKYN